MKEHRWSSPLGHRNPGGEVTNRTQGIKKKNKVLRLIKRDGWKCHWCEGELSFNGYLSNNPDGPWPRFPTIDHIIEKSDGGSNQDINCVLSCQPCNNGRSNPKGVPQIHNPPRRKPPGERMVILPPAEMPKKKRKEVMTWEARGGRDDDV